MPPDCPDGLCKVKIQAIDNAIGHHKNDWHVLLSSTDNSRDLENALQFCEVFHIEAKVNVTPRGYEVLIRNTSVQLGK
jgi:hypothetical protein